MIDLFSRKYVLLAVTVVFAFFIAIVLPDQSEKAAEYTPESGSFDTSYYYSPSVVYEKIELYGEEGRAAYIYNRWTFDLIFPLVYGLFIFSAISFSIARIKWRVLAPRRWVYLAFIAVMFDLLENSFVSLAMGGYPTEYNLLAYGASFSTLFKWFFVVTGLVSAFIFLFFTLVSFLRERKCN